jgi:hypothetical protein
MDSLANPNFTQRQLSQPKNPKSRSKKPDANTSANIDRTVVPMLWEVYNLDASLSKMPICQTLITVMRFCTVDQRIGTDSWMRRIGIRLARSQEEP